MKQIKGKLERVQTGVRLEKRLLKVMKGLAEYMEVPLGELIEIIVLSSFDGTAKFSKGTLSKISDLKRIYELDYGIEAAHMMLFSTKRPLGSVIRKPTGASQRENRNREAED
jgi:hypothetical protein